MSKIIEFFVNIYNFVLSLFSEVFSYLLQLIADLVDGLLMPIADALPDLSSYWDSLSVITPYTAFVNQFVALDLASTLLAAYFAFVVVMIPVKLIIKLFVPTVG